MGKIIKDFKHFSGVHCSSTALLNIVRYYGYNLSEPMCFGLGSGLGFYYQQNARLSPSIFFHGRCYSLETLFFRNHGIDFRWHKENLFPWEKMIKNIDNNVPVLILTDLYYLDYYHTNTHYGGHSVLLIGYNANRGSALLVDTERDGLQETSITSLAQAMSSQLVPLPLYNYWRDVSCYFLQDLSKVISAALTRNCKLMLYPRTENEGLLGLEQFAKDISLWPNLKDFSWSTRFAYQAIERRGTGGGCFRLLYAKFLKEIENYLPLLVKIKAGERMFEIAIKWSDLADVFKYMSENGPSKIKYAKDLALDIAVSEAELIQDIYNSCTANLS